MCHTSECGCGHPAHHSTSRGAGHHGEQCCCAMGYPHRHFPTREEVIAQLDEYLKNLQAEAKGVQERIDELKKG